MISILNLQIIYEIYAKETKTGYLLKSLIGLVFIRRAIESF
jgi:hypothetical protein